MIKFEFDAVEGEAYGTSQNTYPSVIVKEDNMKDVTIDDVFRLWVNFMSGRGYNMSGYYLGNTKDGDL